MIVVEKWNKRGRTLYRLDRVRRERVDPCVDRLKRQDDATPCHGGIAQMAAQQQMAVGSVLSGIKQHAGGWLGNA